MLKKKRPALIGAASAILLVSLFMAFNGKAKQNSQQGAAITNQAASGPTAKAIDDAATPVVDFDNSSAVEPREKNSRKLKNAQYDKYAAVLSDPQRVGEVIIEPEWRAGRSDLPADKSDVLVEGQVTDAKAFLSEDKTGVYSEFTISVSRVLKLAPGLSVNLNDTIVTERFGGRVRYPSGKMIRYRIEGQGSPMQGKKYLFFLAKADGGNYKLLTAYEIQGQKVFALDGSRINFRGRGDSIFDKHNGEDLENFMQAVQKTIIDSQGKGSQP